MRSLIVHGGAWQIPDQEVEAHVDGLRQALARGVALLEAGKSSLDVVVEVVACLEDDPTFDAGVGSVLNLEGQIEMDASLMEGTSMRGGSCLCVTDIANPIRLARAILDDSRAVMLAGAGASRFAREVGIPTCEMEALVVQREIERKAYLDRLATYQVRQPFDGTLPAPPPKQQPPPQGAPYGTVGSVCCDAYGALAAATSTGGAPNTLPGRVGDSPVLGAGTWAENGVGAASCTGWGESIVRELLAFRAVQEIETLTISLDTDELRRRIVVSRGAGDAASPQRSSLVSWGPAPSFGLPSVTSPARAARRAIRAFARRIGGVGGVILLSRDGAPGFAFNTPRMARGLWVEGMGEGIVEIEPTRTG